MKSLRKSPPLLTAVGTWAHWAVSIMVSVACWKECQPPADPSTHLEPAPVTQVGTFNLPADWSVKRMNSWLIGGGHGRRWGGWGVVLCAATAGWRRAPWNRKNKKVQHSQCRRWEEHNSRGGEGSTARLLPHITWTCWKSAANLFSFTMISWTADSAALQWIYGNEPVATEIAASKYHDKVLPIGMKR